MRYNNYLIHSIIKQEIFHNIGDLNLFEQLLIRHVKYLYSLKQLFRS
jgi:hypothetical protein